MLKYKIPQIVTLTRNWGITPYMDTEESKKDSE